jgi:hypothetical protein
VCFNGFVAYPDGSPLQMTLTTVASHAHPGLNAAQTTCGAGKHVPWMLQPAVSTNPHTSVPGHCAAEVHEPPASLVFGHDPTTHEHDPLLARSQVRLRLPPPGQAAMGGGAPHWHAPASGGGAQTGQPWQPLASFWGTTPYGQFGRWQTGGGGQASTAPPESGGGAQIGQVAQPFASWPVPTEP